MIKCIKKVSKEIYKTNEDIEEGTIISTKNFETVMKIMKDDSFIEIKTILTKDDYSNKSLKIIELK